MNKEIEWLLKEKYNGQESTEFHTDCARLACGEPLGFVIGQVPFLDCTIFLDSHPLIPRPETEFWVEKAIAEIKKQTKEPLKVLDLCAGSGAIGVAVGKAIPDAYIAFAELDPSHQPTIKKNINFNLSENEPKIFISDLYTQIPSENKFDFILTNPPYIDAAANTVDISVTEHEPHLALFGGHNGMEIIERIIIDARKYLTPQTGQLWIEHEPFQSEAILTLATAHNFMAVTHPDQYEVLRFSVLTMAQ